MPEIRSDTPRKVATNTFWYGLDTVLGIVMVFAVSIPIARTLGPERLGYFNFIMWLTAMGSTLGGLGVPGTAGRFMAEQLGAGELGTARAIYRTALKAQTVLATTITAAALLILFIWGDRQYWVVSAIQICSILPAMINHVPAQANVAHESMRTNVPGSVAANVVQLVLTYFSLWLHWDLLGIAMASLVARIFDLMVRSYSTERWVGALPGGATVSPVLSGRMRRFALQQTYVLLLSIVIWDKSDVVLLRFLSPDVKQLSYFSVSFNLIEKAVLLPEVFASALSSSLLAQQGRDPSKVGNMATHSARYLMALSFPLMFGLFLVSGPVVLSLYGPKYADAIPVLATAAAFGIIKPLIRPIDAVFRATGRQTRMLVWATLCAGFNVGIDYILIPRLGAIGAAAGNGLSQALLICGYWVIGRIWFGVRIDWGSAARFGIGALAMAVTVTPVVLLLPPIAGLCAGVITGAATFILLVRFTGVLTIEDVSRIKRVEGMAPAQLQPFVGAVVRFVAPSASAATLQHSA